MPQLANLQLASNSISGTIPEGADHTVRLGDRSAVEHWANWINPYEQWVASGCSYADGVQGTAWCLHVHKLCQCSKPAAPGML